MSRHYEKIERVRRNLLLDLPESPQEETYLEFTHENFEESVTSCLAAGVHTFNFHESGRREYRSSVLSESSVSSVEWIPATSLVAEVDESYLFCDNPSRTLSSAMKNLRLYSEQRKSRGASPPGGKSSLNSDFRVGENEAPCVQSGGCNQRTLGRQEPGVPPKRNSERTDRFENLVLQNGCVASAVETPRYTREEEIRAATKKWSCATTVKTSKVPEDEKGADVTEDTDTAKRKRLPAEKPQPPIGDRARRRSSKGHRRSGQFVSMAEAIRKFHTTTPSRYRTYARTAVARCPGKLPSASARSPSRSISAKGSKNSKNEALPGVKKAIAISPSADPGKKQDGSRLGLPTARSTLRLDTSPIRGSLSSAMRSRRELVKLEAALATSTRVQNSYSDHKFCLPVHSVRRLDARQISDGKIRQKEIRPEALRLEAEREQRELHKRELRQLRRAMETRAKPMPKFKPPVIAKSSKPLTEPHSPAWSRRK